jgi:hypothetical protein
MFTRSRDRLKDDARGSYNQQEAAATDDKLTNSILDGQVSPDLLPDVHPTEIRLLFAGTWFCHDFNFLLDFLADADNSLADFIPQPILI